MWPCSSRGIPSRLLAGRYSARPSAITITPYCFPSCSSRTRIVFTIRPITASMFITGLSFVSPLGPVTVSSPRNLPWMSSTLITRLASPAMAAPYESQPALRPIVSQRK